jgi:serine/threonine protein kinase
VVPSTPEEHLTLELLRAFCLGTLLPEPARQVSDHLAFCPTCRLAFVETMNTIELPASAAAQGPQGANAKLETTEPIPTIPGYLRLERISAGGMGIVYHALHSASNQPVAIKVIKPRFSEAYGSDRKERLIREAHALTKINHPNIVRAIETILVNDAPALVMEYIPGQPLHRWIRTHQPDCQTAALLTWQLAQAVAHAHEQGVVHCDLKPHNVLVTSEEHPPHLKLIDFGLAKLSDEDWHITQSGDVLGTPAYMAPEQTTGQPLRGHPAIDIYGLGTILYELITARAPFDASSSTMLLAKVAGETPQRPSQLRPDVPRALERICLKCLEKAPEDRYETAELLAQDLQAFLSGKTIAAKAPPLTKQFLRFLRANRAICALLLITASLAIGGVALLWRDWRMNSQLQASIQQVATENEAAAARAEQAEEAVLDELRISLEETTERLFGAAPSQEDAEWKVLQRLAQRWGRFADHIADSHASQLVRAEAIMRIATIQMTLGDLHSVRDKLQTALDSLPAETAEPTKEVRRLTLAAETYWQIAKCLFDGGQVIESKQAFRDSLSQIEQAEKLQLQNTDHQFLEAKILCDYGTVLTRVSRVQEAQEVLTRSISRLESLQTSPLRTTDDFHTSISHAEVLKRLWASRNALAKVMVARGAAAQATELLEHAPRELKELESQLPDDPTIHRLLSAQKNILAICQQNLGRLEMSKNSFLEALNYQQKVVDQYPSRPDLLKNSAAIYGSLAAICLRLQHMDEALRYVSESLRINSELAERYPVHQEYVGEKAKSLINLVAILTSANQLTEASNRGTELIELQTKLCRDNPHHAEYQYGLAASFNIVASVRGRLGERTQAYSLFEQCQATYEELIAHHPTIATYRTGLINSIYSLADLAIAQQDWLRARDAYARLINSICEPSSESLPAESKLLAKAYLGQALALKALGIPADSETCARMGADTIKPWTNTDPQGQEIFRRCMALVRDR